jgi:hypothetical protein
MAVNQHTHNHSVKKEIKLIHIFQKIHTDHIFIYGK